MSGVDWSLSWERVGRGWDWRGERRFPSKITKAKTMILQSSEQRKAQVSWVSSEKETHNNIDNEVYVRDPKKSLAMANGHWAGHR